jgi:hypothetical protein
MLWNSFIYHIHHMFRPTIIAIICWYYNIMSVKIFRVCDKRMSQYLWCCNELITTGNVSWTSTRRWCYARFQFHVFNLCVLNKNYIHTGLFWNKYFLAILKSSISHCSWKKDEREKRPNKNLQFIRFPLQIGCYICQDFPSSLTFSLFLVSLSTSSQFT